MFICSLQYLLPAIVHINHQPYLERGDGPIVSVNTICFLVITIGVFYLSHTTLAWPFLIPLHPLFIVSGGRPNQRVGSAGSTGRIWLWQVFPYQKHLCLWRGTQRTTDTRPREGWVSLSTGTCWIIQNSLKFKTFVLKILFNVYLYFTLKTWLKTKRLW